MIAKIIGTGGYLPTNVVSNSDLAVSIDTSDAWIKSRTGIAQRNLAAADEFTSHLAYQAGLKAIASAGITNDEIDLLIVCTNTPDNSFPSTANKVHNYLKLNRKIPSFDLQAICSGFIYGLQVADSLIKLGKYRTVLLICADKMSSIVDWQDRKTCVLFGDGGGAVVLQQSTTMSGVIDTEIFSDGSLFDILYTDGGVSSTGTSGKVQMVGSEVFRHACVNMAESIGNILLKNNLKTTDIAYLIPHQANSRIIDHVADQLKIDTNKVVLTIDKHANCSAASIPLALAELQLSGKIRTDDIIGFTAFGAGCTWGAALVRW